MSIPTLREANQPPAPGPTVVEFAPSQVMPDEPTFARTVGMAGGMLAVFGLSVVVITDAYGPRMVSKSWGYVTIALGMVAMLYHALRDADIEIRRLYAIVGYVLIGLCGLTSLIRHELFLSYGWPCLLGGLVYLMAFTRHETNDKWRGTAIKVIGCLGGIMTVVGFFCSIVIQEFVLTYGLVFCLMGLCYLCAYISQVGSDEGPGYRLAQGMGLLGVIVVLYAVVWASIRGSVGLEGYFFIPTGFLLVILGVIYACVSIGITSDNRLVVMTRKELQSYFFSPIAYLVLLGSALMGWINYSYFVERLARSPMIEPIVRNYFIDLFYLLTVIVAVPLVTMRLLSEERRTNTYEVLMSAPIQEYTVVLSKFFAGLLFFMIMWIPWGLYLVALRVELGTPFDYRPLLSFYLAMTFTGAGFVAMGLFFSSLTKNQIVAAVLTFVGMCFPLIQLYLAESILAAPLWKTLLQRLSYLRLWDEAMQGQLAVRDLFLHASLAIFWLFLTVKSLEIRKWS